MINLYRIGKTLNRRITLADMSSLDAITRQLPQGYYSTFRTYDGCTRVIGLTSHLRRLPSADAAFLRRNLRQLLEPYRARGAEARVRLLETNGKELYVALEPLKPLPPEVYEKGVRVETTNIQRHDPRAKSTAFISASDEERKHIAEEGIFEALLVKNGKILEGMTSNFFYILHAPENRRDYPGTARQGRCSERSDERTSTLAPSQGTSAGGSVDEARRSLENRASSTGPTNIGPSAQREILRTAQKEILLGVTRTMVIRVARSAGLEVRYRALELRQIPAVKEAFITSSSRGIVPVIQIDQVQVGQGSVGPVTRELMQAYEEYVLKKAEKI